MERQRIKAGCSEMDEKLKFDYYYGIEAEQFSFYRVPRMLIKDKRFRKLSNDAKLLYGLMIDRMALSMKNAQHIRYSLLITCPLVMIYDVLLHSYGGIVYEGMSIVSAIIGIIRFRKQGQETV